MWSEDVVRHEKKIRRQFFWVGVVVGVLAMIASAFVIDMVIETIRL